MVRALPLRPSTSRGPHVVRGLKVVRHWFSGVHWTFFDALYKFALCLLAKLRWCLLSDVEGGTGDGSS